MLEGFGISTKRKPFFRGLLQKQKAADIAFLRETYSTPNVVEKSKCQISLILKFPSKERIAWTQVPLKQCFLLMLLIRIFEGSE